MIFVVSAGFATVVSACALLEFARAAEELPGFAVADELDVGGGESLDDCGCEELLGNADCDEPAIFADELVTACDEHETSSTRLALLLSSPQAMNPIAAEIMAPIKVTRFMFSP